MKASAWLLPTLLPLALFGLDRLLRRSLAAPRIPKTAVPAGLPWRAVRIPTLRGRQLAGWFVPARVGGAPCLVILHGWGGNAQTMLPLAAPLHAAGYGLLLFDARGHGDSDADTFASLPRFAEDLGQALDWLRGQPEAGGVPIGLIGHSVGAAAALLEASRRDDVAAVVSIAAFAHPASMMRRWLAAKHIPHRPFGASVIRWVERVIAHRLDDIAPVATIGRVRCPVLVVHGMADRTVPPSEALRLYARRRDDRSALLLAAGSHDEFGDPERSLGRLVAFLDGAIGRVGSGPAAAAGTSFSRAPSAAGTACAR